jgi:hypothetical protein
MRIKVLVVAIFLLFSMAQVACADSLSSWINDGFWGCMVDSSKWNDWKNPIGKFADCKGDSYKMLFRASGIYDKLDSHAWMPIKGKATVSDYFILVQFMLDDESIRFFNTRFIGSRTRLPIGLEIDVSPLNNDVFRASGKVFGLNIPKEAGLFLDTSEFDSHPSYGAVIRNPQYLKSGVHYAVVFYAKDAPWYAPWDSKKIIQNSGEVRLVFQVSIDVSMADQMVISYDGGEHRLNGYSDNGEGGAFNYFVVESDGFSKMKIPSQETICWYGKTDDDVGCGRGDPFHDSTANNVADSNGAVSKVMISSGEAILQKGTASIPMKGPGGAAAITDKPVPLLPDLTVRKIVLENGSGKEKYEFGFSDNVHSRFVIENIGKGNPQRNIESHVYISKGSKEDAHSEWRRVGTEHTKPENLKSGDQKTETSEFSISKFISKPGIYNIVACADHLFDDHNNGGAIPEEHESNNCSTEAVFEVVGTPPAPVVRTIKVKDPSSGDKWRTDKEYTIKWENANVPSSTHVRIEFSLNNGSSWTAIDTYALNDGSKKWKPGKFKQIEKDTDKARIRISSVEYSGVSAISEKFKIDHKK